VMPMQRDADETLTITMGRAWPMGAHCAHDGDGDGVNFAVFSANAQSMDLCVFDATGRSEIARLSLPGHSGEVWHGHVRGIGAGAIYGFRAHGPWRPDKGLRFNAEKLLLDPYAFEVVGTFDWGDEHFSADRQHLKQMDTRDNAAVALKARVVDLHRGDRGTGDSS
jgi:isoamylase